MASFNHVPNELLEPIARAIIPGAGLTAGDRNFARQADFAHLAAFVLTCRRFYQAANPVLYAKAAARHPYLLAWAAETRNMAVVKRLFEAGMNPNTLFYCSGGDDPGGADSGARRIWPRDPEFAADPLRLFDAKYLRADADVSTVANSRHFTSTYWAADARILLQGLGCIVRAESSPEGHGSIPIGPRAAFPLHFAAANGDVDMIRVLLAAGALVHVQEYWFCCHRAWDKHLISDPSWTHTYSQMRWTPLHVALCKGQDEAFWALRAAEGAVLELGDGYASVLHHAMQLGRRDIVQRLLDDVKTEEDANRRDENGKSLFWMAYLARDVAAMRRLAKLGADVNGDAPVSSQYTPLFDACWLANVDMVGELLQLGAATDRVLQRSDDIAALDGLGWFFEEFTPLDVCVWLADLPPKDKLVAVGHWERLPDHGVITLEEVMSLGRQLIRLLLDAGADIGSSVLVAARKHRMEAVDALMPYPEFGRYFEAHGVGGILRAMVEGDYNPPCLCCRLGLADLTPDPKVDGHFADLEASLRKYGLLKQDEKIDWKEARRLRECEDRGKDGRGIIG